MSIGTSAHTRRHASEEAGGARRLWSVVGLLFVKPGVGVASTSRLNDEAAHSDQRDWAYGLIVRATESPYNCQM
jgi:hypothetical protein